MKNSKNNWLVPLAFGNIYIIWGLTFVAISYGLQGFPPFILSGLRFLAAGIILLGYLSLKGEKANSLLNWRKNGITGILILTGGTGLVGWGEQFITAAEASIAISTGPFWFIVIDKKNWKKYFSDKWIPIGLVLGFVGLLIFLNGSVSSDSSHITTSSSLRIIAFIVLAFSSVSWVMGSLYSKNQPANHSTFMNISQQLIVAGVASFLIALLQNEWSDVSIQNIQVTAWLGLLFLVLFGSIIAYVSYIWLLSVRPAALVSTHTYINPIVTVLAGWFISKEAINGNQLIGLAIILIGVLLTNISKYFKLSNRSKVKLRRSFRIFIRIGQPYKYAPQP